MEVTNDGLIWTSDDEANWNSFLQTNSGKRLIPKLAEYAPILLDGAHANKTLVRNGELRGFQIAISRLLEMTHSQPLPPQAITPYPDLEDDKQWADGLKIEKK